MELKQRKQSWGEDHIFPGFFELASKVLTPKAPETVLIFCISRPSTPLFQEAPTPLMAVM